MFAALRHRCGLKMGNMAKRIVLEQHQLDKLTWSNNYAPDHQAFSRCR